MSWTALPDVGVDLVSFRLKIFHHCGDQDQGERVPDGRPQPLKVRKLLVDAIAPVTHNTTSQDVLLAMRGNLTIVGTFLLHLPGLTALPIEPIGRGLVFERHALQFTPRVGTGCQRGLLATYRFERTIGGVRKIVVHGMTVVLVRPCRT